MKRKNIATDGILLLLKKSPFLAALLIFVTVGVVLSALAPPYMLRIIIDDYIVPRSFGGLITVTILYLLLVVLTNFFDFLKRLSLILFGQKLYQHLQELLVDKFTKLKTTYYTNNDDGKTSSYFINDVDTINHAFTAGLIGMFIDSLKIIGILVALFLFSPALALVVGIFLPIIAIITRRIQKAMLSAQLKSREITSGVNNAIAETKEVFDMVKLGRREGFMFKRWGLLLNKNYEAAERVNMADSLSSPIAQILRAVVIGIVVYLSPANIGITIGMLAASIELITNLFDPIEAITSELQLIQRSVSGVKRLNELYNEQEQSNVYEETHKDFYSKNHKIEFNNVSFQYTPCAPVLKNISFTANPHEKLAIAGRTGVGKTTMFNLLTGLYEPDDGSVRISGVDASKIPPKNRRRLFAYVSQSFTPIIGTFMEQISLKDINVSKEQACKAAELVGIKDVLEPLYDKEYRRGVLSSGQEQLLNIARAIVLEPKILLLDEMSAKLDSISEEHIYEAIDTVSADKTSISISHRLSSILNSHRLIYVKDGSISKSLNLAGNSGDRDWVVNKVAVDLFEVG